MFLCYQRQCSHFNLLTSDFLLLLLQIKSANLKDYNFDYPLILKSYFLKLAVMWSKRTSSISFSLRSSSSSSCLTKLLIGLQRGGGTPRCTLGIVVQEEGGVLQWMRLVDGGTRRRLAERGGEQRQLQLVDGAGGEGLRLVRRGAAWGWGAGRHGYASLGTGGRAGLRVVCGERASQFGPSVLKPHLEASDILCV